MRKEINMWYRIAKFLYRFEAFQDALERVLDERLRLKEDTHAS